MKKVYIISIRYTLLTPRVNAFLQQESLGYEKFKIAMLDSKRLQSRLMLFKNIALPSLQKFFSDCVKDVDSIFKVIINASSLLPDSHQKELMDIEKKNKFIQVVFSNEDDANIRKVTINQMKKLHKNEDTLFVTMRMDDDDAISDKFYENIKKYADVKYAGFGVSFPNGYIGYIDENHKFLGFRNYKKPNIAIGLGYICFVDAGLKNNFKTIYCLGSHGSIDIRVPVINDSSFKSFVRTAHLLSDVYSDEIRLKREIEQISKDIKSEDIWESFSLKNS